MQRTLELLHRTLDLMHRTPDLRTPDLIHRTPELLLRVRVSMATIMLTFHLSQEDHQMVSFQFKESKQSLIHTVITMDNGRLILQ